MEQRVLGRTGLRVSALGFGCGAIGGLMVKGEAAEQRRAIAHAVEAGVRYFDTAPSYGDGRSEERLGRSLADLDGRAAGVVVGTKFRLTAGQVERGEAARLVRESLEASLRRLRRERVHLFQLHTKIVRDPAPGEGTPAGGLTAGQVLDPVLEAARAVRDAGLCEHIGITATGDLDATRRVLESGAAETAQIFFNVLHPSAGWPPAPGPAGSHDPPKEPDFSGLIDIAAGHQVGVLVIRPFAAGALASVEGRHPNAGHPGGIAGERYDDDLARSRALAALAAELGLESPLELALRFVLARPGVSTALVGFSDTAQVEQALRWAARGALPPDAVARALALSGAVGPPPGGPGRL